MLVCTAMPCSANLVLLGLGGGRMYIGLRMDCINFMAA
jgi:hypothetical protein